MTCRLDEVLFYSDFFFFFQMESGSMWENAFFGKLNAGVSKSEVTGCSFLSAGLAKKHCTEIERDEGEREMLRQDVNNW